MSRDSFHARHPGLIWSVDRPSDVVLMRAALLAPRFQTLLDACLEFGAARLRAEWQFLRRQPGLTGFVLMGGSALALRLGHRQSEDLDFAWPGPRRF